MQFYSLDAIKAAGDCLDYLRQHGYKEVKPGFFNIPWRAGSDSGALHVEQARWYDHVAKEGGGIIDLAMRLHGYDLMEASEHLGQFYNLASRAAPVVMQRSVKAEYVYTNAEGKPAHKTVRMEPKDFVQYRFENDQWVAGLGTCKRYLYNLPQIIASNIIYFVEGEKDADNLIALGLPATTVAMGANKWDESYTPYFTNKRVIVLRDNDDEGEAHANRIAWELRNTALSVKCALTSQKPKGDVSDWLADGGTLEALMKICEDARPVIITTEPIAVEAQREDSVTERVNVFPFRNYAWADQDTPTGDTKREKVPISIVELVKQVFDRCNNFPKSVGGTLFDFDRKKGRIRYLNNADELFAWLCERTRHNVSWSRGEGCVSRPELFAAIHAKAERYEAISAVPTFPQRLDVFYAHPDLPEPHPRAKHFQQLIDFFAPASETDKTLLKVMFASPLYWEYKVDRPLWVIDSVDGQGVGKTKAIEMLAMLYGVPGEPSTSEPIWVDSEQLQNETSFDRVLRRLLSGPGRQKRIFLLDNVAGYMKCQQLASLVTQGSMSGMSPYARGEETRPNDLTYCITSNNATMDRDLIHRAFFIHMKHPGYQAQDWARQVANHIEAHRLKIIAEMRMIMDAGAQFEFSPVTRFREWERKVLAPMVGNMASYNEVFKLNEGRKSDSDGEHERADTVRDFFRDQISGLGYDPDKDILWLPNNLLRHWCNQAVPGFGGRTGSGTTYALKAFCRTKMISELGDEIKKFPHHGARQKRGMMWNIDMYCESIRAIKKPKVTILKLDDNYKVEVECYDASAGDY